MTREEIEAFLAVSKYGTLSAAAEHIHISQPALGKRLKQLEEELGTNLLERGKGIRQIALTSAGTAFHSYAERFIKLSDEMALVGSARQQAERRTLDIASSDGPHIFVLTDANLRFKKNSPDTFLRLHTYAYRECYRRVASGKIDAAIVGASYYFENVVTVPLYSEKMVFVCRSDSSYPKTVDLKDLDLSDCVYSPYSSDFSNWFSFWFRMAGNPFIESDLVGQVRELLLAMDEMAWSIVPETVANAYMTYGSEQQFETRELKEAPPDRTMYLITATGLRSDTLASYIDELSRSIEKNPSIRKLI